MTTRLVRKKAVSKKRKASWRKHVNINDVEEFLEDKRLEERLGSLADVADEEIFKIDFANNNKEAVCDSRTKARLKLQNPKCFAALRPSSKVPDPISKRNYRKTKKAIKSQKNKNPKKYSGENDNKSNAVEDLEYKDIWDEETTSNIEKNEWLEKNTKKHNLAGVGKLQKQVSKSVREKKSILPAVEVPHPGMSYNPSLEDHQNLIQEVVKKEQEIIKKEEHLRRVTSGMFTKVAVDKRDSDWVVEMSQGLPNLNNGPTDEDGQPSDNEYKSVNPPVVNKKKTNKQRRKQKEQRALELARKAAKLEKKKIIDIHRLKMLNNIIEKKTKQSLMQQKSRKEAKEKKKVGVKRLGAMKFEEPDLEFISGNELTGNLRSLKKECNLLADRFKSLQKRNILQPTKKQVRKRAKVKKYTKPGYKDEEWKKTVAR